MARGYSKIKALQTQPFLYLYERPCPPTKFFHGLLCPSGHGRYWQISQCSTIQNGILKKMAQKQIDRTIMNLVFRVNYVHYTIDQV
jgi:hypothetical protein